jgi:hypothetical protein
VPHHWKSSAPNRQVINRVRHLIRRNHLIISASPNNGSGPAYLQITRWQLAPRSRCLPRRWRPINAPERLARLSWVEGMVVTGRDGQTKVHPLLAVERDARQAWLAGIKALGLEL